MVAMTEQEPRINLTEAERLMPDLYDAMTGGNFRVEGRSADMGRAQAVQAVSAQLNGQLRMALGRRSRLWR